MSKRSSWRSLVLLSGLLLGLAGCRSRSAAPAPTSAAPAKNPATAQASEPQAVTSASVRDAEGGPDPCALLKRGEIEPLLGATVKEGKRAGKTACRWKPESGPGYVTLQFEPRNGQSIYDFARRAVPDDSELPGVGDQAFQSPLTVGVRVGERFLSVTVAPNDPKKALPPKDAVQLAKKALKRLPTVAAKK